MLRRACGAAQSLQQLHQRARAAEQLLGSERAARATRARREALQDAHRHSPAPLNGSNVLARAAARRAVGGS